MFRRKTSAWSLDVTLSVKIEKKETNNFYIVHIIIDIVQYGDSLYQIYKREKINTKENLEEFHEVTQNVQ